MLNQSLKDLRRNQKMVLVVQTQGNTRHKAGRTTHLPLPQRLGFTNPATSKHFLETLWVQFAHHTFKMAAQIPEAVGRLVDFGPCVCLVVVIVLVKGVLAAGAKHVLFHHDLCGPDKQVQPALKQHGLYIRAGGLVKGQIFLTAPCALLDVVDLHGEGALVVLADAGDVVDTVLM